MKEQQIVNLLIAFELLDYLIENNYATEKYIGKKFANNRAAASGLLRRILFASKKEVKELRR